MIVERPPYSYRDDPAVPDFADARPIAFIDGACMLCATGARLIARLDHSETIRICPIQTPLGHAILAHYGMDPEDPATWLFLEDGIASSSFDGMIRVGRASAAGAISSGRWDFCRAVSATGFISASRETAIVSSAARTSARLRTRPCANA
ncbi:thiol-disulfide oxidoreductase DCC family protein [Methyloceanibacter superfactus]|uniref:thiol-disulfide oxidoreductase DCC family protein n=1 Tax=Methyloceanibacter superfactus TaxID=1774969 RepID=UPI00195E7963|nr:DUF393 domain-containing protein [Methyloceanibacter superfactus]